MADIRERTESEDPIRMETRGVVRNLIRQRFVFRGTVQGVGFRPTVYRCASELGLSGFVQNRRSEVIAEVEGQSDRVESFTPKLRELLPPAAKIESVEVIEGLPLDGSKGFQIAESRSNEYTFPPIPPDLALCSECRRELLDPENRRYLYPFITCTQCGPRFSIVEDTPFDRENTSMVDFAQCEDCLAEYTDPLDRRFHSQTNSCHRCGPRLVITDGAGENLSGDPVTRVIEALSQGRVAAIQGIGGFHLAVDPSARSGMERLRSDKERERKPFALMVKDLQEARRLCFLDQEDEAILRSPESPILILPCRADGDDHLSRVSETWTLGLMLPYTPLHFLLFHHPELDIPYKNLVMTSGNLKGQPIITDPGEAVRKLSGIADLFLFNNRRIIFRTDDSVTRRVSNIGPRVRTGSEPSHGTRLDSSSLSSPCILRRSRGYVPATIELRHPVETSTLALGGDLKNAPGFASNGFVYLCPYVGDLEGTETMDAFENQIRKVLSLYRVEPKRLVFDSHPLYLSTRWANEQKHEYKVSVQHHHAHILSVMAEAGLEETLGLAFDGTGYGPDGTIWGGEFLHCTRQSYTRMGSFRGFPLPGAEAAVLHPKRIAFALLDEKLRDGLDLPARQRDLLEDMLAKEVHSPITSAVGRIFDAAAAVLGLVETVSYEGEGPIRLEGLAGRAVHGSSSTPDESLNRDLLPLCERRSDDGRSFLFDPRPLIEYLFEKRGEGDHAAAALTFHRAIASAGVRAAETMRAITGLNRIALSGGVFQNMLLLGLLIPTLKEHGFEVYLNRDIPPGDGGLAVGQAYFDSTR
jgi:hydrogenase maturation protein HypF